MTPSSTNRTHTVSNTTASTPPPSQDASQSRGCFAVGTGRQGTPDGPGLRGGGTGGTEGNTGQQETQDTADQTLVPIPPAAVAPAAGAAPAPVGFFQTARHRWNLLTQSEKVAVVMTGVTVAGAVITLVAAPSSAAAAFHPSTHPATPTPCDLSDDDCIPTQTPWQGNPALETLSYWVREAFVACLNGTESAGYYAGEYMHDVVSRLTQLHTGGNLTESAAQCLSQLHCPDFFNQTSGPVAMAKAVNASFLSQIGDVCTPS